MPVVVLAKMKAGQVQEWKRLDKVWGLVGDKPAFAAYVRDEIKQMLGDAEATRRRRDQRGKRSDCLLASPPANLPLPRRNAEPAFPSDEHMLFP